MKKSLIVLLALFLTISTASAKIRIDGVDNYIQDGNVNITNQTMTIGAISPSRTVNVNGTGNFTFDLWVNDGPVITTRNASWIIANQHNDFLNATGTLTDGKWCRWDASASEIDCNIYPVLNNSDASFLNVMVGGGWTGGGITLENDGDIWLDGSLYLTGNISEVNVNQLTINSSMKPSFDDVYSLGTAELRWKNLSIGTGTSEFNGDVYIDKDTISDVTLALIANTNMDACINLTEGGIVHDGIQLCYDGSGENQFKLINTQTGYVYMDIDRDDGIITFHNSTIFDTDVNVTGNFTASDLIAVNSLVGSYLVSRFVGNMDMRGDPWAILGVGLQVEGNSEFQGNLVVDDNATATYFIGDGSQLTGIQQGQLILYFLDKSSADVANNKTISSTPNTTTQVTYSKACTDGNNFMGSWITNAGVPAINLIEAGIVDVHVHGKQTVGTKLSQFFFKLYKVDSTGANPVLIFTSAYSDYLTGSEQELDVHSTIPADIQINSTDRLLIEGWTYVSGGGSDPTVEAYVQGSTATRFTLPVGAISVEKFIPYTNAVNNIDLNNKNLQNVNKLSVNSNSTFDSGTLFVDSTGDKVGIGTTTPSEKLNVNGSLRVDNASGTGVFIVNATTGAIGIGTTSPDEGLEVFNKNIKIGDNANAERVLYFERNNALVGKLSTYLGYFTLKAQNNAGLLISDDSDNGIFVKDGGNIGIGTISPNYLLQVEKTTTGKDVNLSNTLFVNGTAGRVGIGTTSPVTQFEVYGASAGISLTRTSSEPFIRLSDSGYSNGGQLRGVNGAKGLRLTDSSGVIDWLRIDANGNVGINTTSPKATLHINGTANIENALTVLGRGNFTTDLWVNNAPVVTTANTSFVTANQIYGVNGSTTFGGDVAGAYNAIQVLTTNGLSFQNITNWQTIITSSNASFVTSNQNYGLNASTTDSTVAFIRANQAYGANMTQVVAANTSMKDYADKTFTKNATDMTINVATVTSRAHFGDDDKLCFGDADDICLYYNSTLGAFVGEKG